MARIRGADECRGSAFAIIAGSVDEVVNHLAVLFVTSESPCLSKSKYLLFRSPVSICYVLE